jgi:hypothetical protein
MQLTTIDSIRDGLSELCEKFNQKTRSDSHLIDWEREIVPKIDLFELKNFIKQIPAELLDQINWDEIELLLDFGPHSTVFITLSGVVYRLGSPLKGNVLDNYSRYHNSRHHPTQDLCDDYNTDYNTFNRNIDIGIVKKPIIFLLILDCDVDFLNFFFAQNVDLNHSDVHLISPLYFALILHHFDCADLLYERNATIPTFGNPCHLVMAGNGLGNYKTASFGLVLNQIPIYENNRTDNEQKDTNSINTTTTTTTTTTTMTTTTNHNNDKNNPIKHPQISTMLRYAFTYDIPNFLEWVLTRIETSYDEDFNNIMDTKDQIKRSEALKSLFDHNDEKFSHYESQFELNNLKISHFLSKLIGNNPPHTKYLEDLFKYAFLNGQLFNIYTLFTLFNAFIDLSQINPLFDSGYSSILRSLSDTNDVLLVDIILESVSCSKNDRLKVLSKNQNFKQYLKVNSPNRPILKYFIDRIIFFSLGSNSTHILDSFQAGDNNVHFRNAFGNEATITSRFSSIINERYNDIFGWISPKGLDYMINSQYQFLVGKVDSNSNNFFSARVFFEQKNSLLFPLFYPFFRNIIIQQFHTAQNTPNDLILPQSDCDFFPLNESDIDLHRANLAYWFRTILSYLHTHDLHSTCWLLSQLPVSITKLFFSYVHFRGFGAEIRPFAVINGVFRFHGHSAPIFPLFTPIQFYLPTPLFDIYQRSGGDLSLKCDYHKNIGILLGPMNQYPDLDPIIKAGQFTSPKGKYDMEVIKGATALMVAMLTHTGFNNDIVRTGVVNPSAELIDVLDQNNNEESMTSLSIGSVWSGKLVIRMTGEDRAAFAMEKIINGYIEQGFPPLTHKHLNNNDLDSSQLYQKHMIHSIDAVPELSTTAKLINLVCYIPGVSWIGKRAALGAIYAGFMACQGVIRLTAAIFSDWK